MLDSFSSIERIVHRKHKGKFRLENDTEHSYNLAMTAWFLAKWFPELDKDRLIKYALVHDLVEVHAGDTYIYGPADHINSKAKREAKALKKLKKDWADFVDMVDSLEEYESRANAEANFIYALDKIMPAMAIYINDGFSFKKHEVTTKMFYDAKVAKVSLSPEILPYFEQLHTLLLEHPEIIQRA